MANLVDRVVAVTNPRGFARVAPDLAQLSGMMMKGFALQNLEELAALHYGPQALDPWLATLPPKLKEQADPQAILSIAWVPVELYYGALSFLVQQFHQGDVRQAMVLGNAAAAKDISVIFRTALQFASPPTVLGLSGRFWRSYFDRSQLVLTRKDTGIVEAEVRDWPFSDEVSLYEVAGSLVAWMEASKARDVTISRLELLAPNTFLVGATWH